MDVVQIHLRDVRRAKRARLVSAVDHARETLRAHWRVLVQQWDATCEVWRDQVRDRFEKEYWHELSHIVPQTLDELERLAGVLAQARRQVR